MCKHIRESITITTQSQLVSLIGAVGLIWSYHISTFAWYQANTLSGKAVNTNTLVTNAPTVDDPGYAAEAVNLPIVVSVSRITKQGAASGYNTKLELGTWIAAGDDTNTYVDGSGASTTKSGAGLYRAYYKTTENSSLVYTKAQKDGYDDFAVYKVSAQIAWESYANAGAADSVTIGYSGFEKKGASDVVWVDTNGNEWTRAKVGAELIKSGSKNIYINVNRDTTSNPSRAMFFGGTTTAPTVGVPMGEGEGSDGLNATNSNRIESALDGIYVENGADDAAKYPVIAIGYFGLYVEGNNGRTDDSGAADSSQVYADFKVTVEGR